MATGPDDVVDREFSYWVYSGVTLYRSPFRSAGRGEPTTAEKWNGAEWRPDQGLLLLGYMLDGTTQLDEVTKEHAVAKFPAAFRTLHRQGHGGRRRRPPSHGR